MRARYYMPDLMRFINQDIVTGDISNSNSLNRYTYVEGNPATMIDPFGLCAERVDRTVRGASSTMWGTCEMFMGYGAVQAGTAMMAIPLPGCRILGFGLIVCGFVEAIFGANDVTEGAQDVVCGIAGVSDEEYKSLNPLRDVGFQGDYEAYYNAEMTLTCFNAVGMEYASNKMWMLDSNSPNIAKNASYNNPETEGGSEKQTLYHYTNQKGLTGITESNQLNPSLKANNPNDARYGNGQYLSDIEPQTTTPAQLAKKFINIPNKYKYTCYIEIDVSDLNVIQGRECVYVIPNEVPLDLTGRIISSGMVGR